MKKAKEKPSRYVCLPPKNYTVNGPTNNEIEAKGNQDMSI